jgi:predicted DCC family thiol-disulfide oxidoreductase YuxK
MQHAPFSYRQDSSVPSFADDKPIIIFDGVCAFCSAWVQFALKHDKSGEFRFIPAQSDLGHALYVHYGLDPTDYQTNILIENGIGYFKSDGSIRMIKRLGFPFSLVRAARILPPPVLDWGYELIAQNRFRLFGRRDSCFMPTPELANRFLA